METEKRIAKDLLSIGAVFLRRTSLLLGRAESKALFIAIIA